MERIKREEACVEKEAEVQEDKELEGIDNLKNTKSICQQIIRGKRLEMAMKEAEVIFLVL